MTFAALSFSFDASEEPGAGPGTIALRPVPNPRYGTGKLWSGTDTDVLAEAIQYLALQQASRPQP
jgi:hypothetical protein